MVLAVKTKLQQRKHPTKYILFLHLARPYFASKNLCKKMTMYVSKCLAWLLAGSKVVFLKKLTASKMVYAIMYFITGTNVFAIGNHLQEMKDLCQSKYNLRIP